jgi:hypothetical protein
MAEPIKYTDIYLYSTNNAASATMRAYLDTNSIDYVNLNYVDDAGKTATLSALSTWFDDTEKNDGSKIEFTSLPILIFEKLFWESDDKSEKLQKRAYALTSDTLPSDFLTKAKKLAS